MTIYLLLIAVILILGAFYNDTASGKRRITYVSFLLIYIICVIRDYSVGVDLPAYKDAYEMASSYDWFDASWIYMESGYVFFMKLCGYLGLSFRGFMCILYLLLFIPLSLYVKKYSKDPALSVVIFICFTFFVSIMSALRQSVAFAFCLLAFMEAQKCGKKHFFAYILYIIFAALMHKSAIVFAPVYFIMRRKLTAKRCMLYVLVGIISSLLKPVFIKYLQDNDISKYGIEANLSVGASLVFILLITVLPLFFNTNRRREYIEEINSQSNIIHLNTLNFANVLAFSALLQVSFSGTILMRAAMYYQSSIMILVPVILCSLNKKMQPIARVSIIILMLSIFYLTVLVPKQFDIVPYIIGKDLL